MSHGVTIYLYGYGYSAEFLKYRKKKKLTDYNE